jgi:hypothetical protein
MIAANLRSGDLRGALRSRETVPKMIALLGDEVYLVSEKALEGLVSLAQHGEGSLPSTPLTRLSYS